MSKENLCTSCKFDFSSCKKETDQAITFGNGEGNDNVISCAWYEEDGNRNE